MSDLDMMQLLDTDALKPNIAHSVSQVLRGLVFLARLPRFPHCALSATVNVPLRPMTVPQTVSLPHASNDPFPDDVSTVEPTNCLPTRQAALSRALFHQKSMRSQKFHCCASHGA